MKRCIGFLLLLCGLKQHKFTPFNSGDHFNSGDRLKSRCQQDCVPPGGSREEPVSLSLPAFRGHLRSSASGPFLHLQSWWHSIFQSLWLWPSLSCSFIYKDPCDYVGPYGQSSVISQAQNPSPHLQSLFCHAGCHTYRFRELGCRPLRGALFCLSQVC